MDKRMDYYEDFKPIRNKIRSLHFLSALKRLYLLTHKKPPAIVPEISEFLYLNLVVYAEGIRPDKEEKYWNTIIHECMLLSNKVSAAQMEKGLWKWLRAMSLNQLKSHSNYYFHAVYRYYSIFSDPVISRLIEDRLGIPYKAYFICGLWLHSVFSRRLTWPRAYFTGKNNGGPLFVRDNMEKTLNLLTIPLAELQTELKAAMNFDEDVFIFQGYPHLIHPIVELDQSLYCMYPDHLLKQLVSGIYYIAAIGDNASKVSAEFGKGFENYVGTVLEKNNAEGRFSIRPEITYAIGKNGNLKTSDWIIETGEAIIFLECKTKRLSLDAKKMMQVDEKGQEDLTALTKAITQLYKVYAHYQNNDIPGLPYQPEKKFIPLVITLEEWFAGGPDQNEYLTTEVKKLLAAQGIPQDAVDKFHFRTYSINNFETDVQQMFYLGFASYFEHLTRGTLTDAVKDWVWQSYFEKEFDELFIVPFEQFRNT